MTPEEFRKYGHRIVDRIADYRAGIEVHPVASRAEPGSIKAQMPSEPPVEPESFEDVLADVERLVMPNLAHWQHPRFFGYFPSNGELSAVLGDYLSTGLGVLGLAWQSSPPLTEIEEVATDWLRQMSGLSSAWSGVIQDTASTSSLVALLCAREKSSNFSLTRGGLQSEQRALVVYTSEHAHSSIDKAALMAGFGRENLRKIPVDASFALKADVLEAAIQADREEGRIPCAIVATTGTTTTTAMDPIEACARIAREHGLWLHVDGAMAGSAMILPECRNLWRGIEGADSIVVNPHKWLGASFDCSVYYVRDPDHLVRVMSTSPSYLKTAADGSVKNYRDWGIPLGRRFRALKLWCLIREQGVSGLQKRLRRDIENARWLEGEFRASPGWSVVAPVVLQTVCVRHEPAGISGESLDTHTLSWVAAVNASGTAYITPALLEGRWMARISIGAILTEREHVAQTLAAMREATSHSG